MDIEQRLIVIMKSQEAIIDLLKVMLSYMKGDDDNARIDSSEDKRDNQEGDCLHQEIKENPTY